MGEPRTHYEILGVPAGSDLEQIRTAYRRLARDNHPDRHGGRTTPDMIRINEAWRVLSNAERRRTYDDRLTNGQSSPSAHVDSSVDAFGRHRHVSASATPARFPWKFVVSFFAVATAVILLVGAFTDPGQDPPIDNVIRVGSCVNVDRRIQEAREVTCDGPHDAQVVSVVPFDSTCPVNTETFRDRQGLGLVCTAA